MSQPSEEQKKNQEKQKQYNGYLKYSGLAIQMVVTIYLGSILGKYLDSLAGEASDTWFKIVTLLAVFISIFAIIRQVSNSQNNN